MKYLMLGHLRVLAGEKTYEMLGEDDLLLQTYSGDGKQVLRNGVVIVKQLNELVEKYGYQVVFHSTNSERDQLQLLQQLELACEGKGIKFPRVVGMAEVDLLKDQITSDEPVITRSGKIPVASYGVEKNGKACVREALLKVLGVKEGRQETIRQSIVFDSSVIVVNQALEEGYQARRIGGYQGEPLDVALAGVIKVEKEQAAEAAKKQILAEHEREMKQAEAAALRKWFNAALGLQQKQAQVVVPELYKISYTCTVKDGNKSRTIRKNPPNALTPQEVNQEFLELLEAIDGSVVMKFEFELLNKDNTIYVYFDLGSCQARLEARTGLVVPVVPQEVAVGAADVETIQEIHRQILQMTKQYKQEHEQKIKGKSDPKLTTKIAIFEELQKSLQNLNKTKHERLKDFANLLQEKDANLKEHRTDDWKRYVLNVLSILTVLPGVARVLHSCYNYGTVRFWKPESEKVQDLALRQCAKLDISPRA